MSKPTPLTAASLANIELEIKAREGNGETRQDDPLFLRLLATIAELQRELEGYRQALAQRGHVAEFREDGWSLEHPVECRAIGLIDCAVNLACGYEQTAPQLGRFVVTVNEDGFLVLGERVLAGKEAQCPKCEGRGFIRTMVDGERDSEPCSFCRMSGLAGKEAQGD